MVKIADVHVDAADEHRRIDAAIDAKPVDVGDVVAVTGCQGCGAPPHR